MTRGTAPLRQAVIVFETEGAAATRLMRHGYPAGVAREIAVYLAQATDLPGHMDEIRTALAAQDIETDFVELDALPDKLGGIDRERSILWAQTDGFRFYRGSSVPALARLAGVARYGSPAAAQHLCQDKFASLALAGTAGLSAPPTLLLDGDEVLGSLGDPTRSGGELFVKPATLGAKIGIFADSRCRTLGEAKALSRRIAERYGDRAVVQSYIDGDDVRVSFMDIGGSFADQLGIFRLKKDPAGETGGAFVTMRDNETLSGAKDTAGGRGAFGEAHEAAFTPEMVDLKRDGDAAARQAAARIAEAAGRLARLLPLRDYFSMDFRIDAQGSPVFFEFETCPAVTIYDFSAYLKGVSGLSLGDALGRSMRLAFERRSSRIEA